MNKKKKIEIRVSEEEKALIEMLALEGSQTASAYLLNCALNRPLTSDANLRKSVVTMMCRLNLLCDTIESVQIRNAIKDLEEDVWQYLK